MTIIQVSICNKHEAIILIADRLVTVYETYEAESKSAKLYPFNNFGIGFAGSLSDIICIKDKMNSQPTFKEFIDHICEIYKKENKHREEQFIYNNTFLTKEEFKEYIKHDQGKIPENIIEWIYANLEKQRLDCIALIVGFNDKNKPQIISLDTSGDIDNQTVNFHSAIGTGEFFSEVFFDVNEYDPNCSMREGLLFAFRAKKSAEAHRGVGKNTDILILNLNKEPIIILHESEEMRKLEKLYKEEKNKIQEIFNITAKQLDGEIFVDETRQT